jgi:hypothetical protein
MKKKSLILLLGALCILGALLACGGASNAQEQTGVQSTGKPTQTTQHQKAIQKMNIVVTSQIVKKVGGKHRYFFDVRNQDKQPFNGSVTIELYNDKQSSPLGQDTFNTTAPMQPSLGTSVSLDIATGPTSVAGEYGITHFKYSVKVNDSEVNVGSGTISQKYEDLS